MKRLLLFCCIAVIASAGCAKEVKYTPNPGAISDPKVKIEDAIKAQPISVHKVEVTDKYFKVEAFYPAGYWGGGGLDVTIVYYENIASFELYERRGLYLIDLYDSNKQHLCHIRVKNEKLATDFIDAIYKMKSRP